MSTKAVYAGTFDPITNGHLWVIREAVSQFDKVVVLVANNPAKRDTTAFTTKQRVEMITASVRDLSNIEIVSLDPNVVQPFTVKYAEKIGATHLVRGVRNGDDFGQEQAILHINEDICPEIKTIFITPPRNLSEISSSMVKSLVGFEDWKNVVAKYVPECVLVNFLYLHSEVDEVMMRLGVAADVAVHAKSIVERAYEQPRRHYHNRNHIEQCLKLLKLAGMNGVISAKDFDKMALAFWFHDVVYDTKRHDNEVESMKLFKTFSKGMCQDDIFDISSMIQITEGHYKSTDNVWNVFSDIDMARLGSGKQDFLNYNNEISDEYGISYLSRYKRKKFDAARKKFLLGLLSEEVYHSEFFRKMFHDAMVNNVKELLSKQYKDAK